MSRLLPLRSDPQPGDQGPRIVGFDGEDADEVFNALSSDTARDIYRSLHEEPTTPSDLSDRVDTSLQNARYHLENLEDAGLIEVVDTWYSSRGNEMSVYAPTSETLILSSDQEEASRLKTALSRLVGGVGLLAVASFAVQRIVERFAGGGAVQQSPAGGGGGDAGGGGAENFSQRQEGTATEADGGVQIAEQTTTAPPDGGGGGTREEAATTAPQATETREPGATEADAQQTVTETVANSGADAVEAAGSLEPGVLFFLGGAVVLVAAVAYWYAATPSA